MGAFGVHVHSAKQFCVGTLKVLFQMRAKRAEISNFAQIFVKIGREARRNLKFKFYFSKRGSFSVGTGCKKGQGSLGAIQNIGVIRCTALRKRWVY